MPFAAIVPQLRAVGNLPAPVRGALWMCGAAAAFAGMVNLVRLLSAGFDPLQIVFFRTAFGLLAMLPWLAGHGLGALRTERLGLHLLRAAIGLAAMVLWFTTLALLPLAEATALSFTAPVFTSVLAVVFLGEAMRARRWTATAIGFLGALIVLRPGVEAVNPSALLAIATAAIWATSTIVVKILARTDEPAAIATYMTLLLTPLSLVPALLVWRTPGLTDLGLCVLLGAAGSIGHVCMARALATSEASLVMPFDYLRLPLVAFFAYLLFDQVPDVWTWVGGAVIAGSSLYIAQREARARRAAAATAPMARPAPPRDRS
ncbi:MAG TPA: DMT family transporter [Geminicoccaceae bacterium]|nr:DMT family transporter [Geminicoccaceae bacterium]